MSTPCACRDCAEYLAARAEDLKNRQEVMKAGEGARFVQRLGNR
ncbi:hypothetical protein ACWD4L_36840 [Streptomyces sp. NPDC002596]